MRLLSHLIFSITFLLLPVSVWALSPEQKQVLTKIERQVKSSPQMLGRFSQKKTLPQLPRSLISNGVIAISQERGVSWRIESPIKSHRIFRDKTDDQNGEYPADLLGQQIAKPLINIMLGNFSSLEESFYLEVRLEQKLWRLRLTPKMAAFSNVLRSIEISGNEHVKKIILAEANEAITEMEFQNMSSVNHDNTDLIAEFSFSNKK